MFWSVSLACEGPRADFGACYTIHQFLLHVVVSYKALSPPDYTFLHAPDGLLGHRRPHSQYRTVLDNVKRMDQVLISLVQTSSALGQRS